MYNYLVSYVANANKYKGFGVCSVNIPNLVSSVEDQCLKDVTEAKLSPKFAKCEFKFAITLLGFQLCNNIH